MQCPCHTLISHHHLVAGVLSNTEGATELLPLLYCEAVLEVEHRLLPVRVARVGSCVGQQWSHDSHTTLHSLQAWPLAPVEMAVCLWHFVNCTVK